MSENGEIEQDDICHVNTPEAFLERLQATQAEGISFMDVIHDIPPDECATSHPEAFKEGFPLPNAEGSNVTLAAQTGIYTFAGLAQTARDIYIQHNPNVELNADIIPEATETIKGLTAQFSSIASLFTQEQVEATKPKIQNDEQEHAANFDLPAGPR